MHCTLFASVELLIRMISPIVMQTLMTLKALMMRYLPLTLTFQGLIRLAVMSDHRIAVFFLEKTSPWPHPRSL